MIDDMIIEYPILEALASLLQGVRTLGYGEDSNGDVDLEELILQARIETDACTEIEKYGRWLKPGEEYA